MNALYTLFNYLIKMVDLIIKKLLIKSIHY